MKTLTVPCAVLLVALLTPSGFAQSHLASCTTTIVTAGASADGSIMVSHSDDDDLADQSIVFVPARDWPAGAMRPVYPSGVALDPLPEYNALPAPRLTAPERAPGYALKGEKPTLPLGHIPQVRHTYSYLDGSHGIANEHGVMFGECTNGTLFTVGAELGVRLFYTAELSRVALERCKTARCAVDLIGELIETYGYHGMGETLPVADKDEAWVIEIAPTPATDGQGGLWVAQRVPDGEFFIAANEFRIRDIIPGNPEKQRYGKTLLTIERLGIAARTPKGTVDWLLTVSKGEISNPYFALRRVWRGLSLVAPSLNLDPWVKGGDTRSYPFSIKPDKKLSFADLRAIHSDHYEGTQFDLTKGLAAGPFGNPKRYYGLDHTYDDVDENMKLTGAWERPICMYSTGYTTINQLQPSAPYPLNLASWVALNTPGESTFVPLAVAPLPREYERGDTRRYDKDSAWWTYNLVAEYANLKYSHMIRDIQKRAALHESRAEALLVKLRNDLTPLARKNPQKAGRAFAKALAENALAVRADWQELFFELVAKYAQGFVNSPDAMARAVDYPKEWLDKTNYREGPIRYARLPRKK